jgi:hypothetical protein
MPLNLSWTETIDGKIETHVLTYTDAELTTIAAFKATENAPFSQALADAVKTALTALIAPAAQATAVANAAIMQAMLMSSTAPIYIPPSQFAVMPDESVLTVGVGGEVYLDGVRLGTARVTKLVKFGRSVFGLGKTDGLWWQWTGTTWINVTQLDGSILK